MNVLAFAEERGGKMKKSSLETVRAGRRFADLLGGEFAAVVVGSGVAAAAAGLGRYGASRVIAVDDPKLARHANAAVAKIIAEVALAEHAGLRLSSREPDGERHRTPRRAQARRGTCRRLHCAACRRDEIIATRPVFAGKALLDVRVATHVSFLTLRPNTFDAAEESGDARVELRTVPLEEADLITTVQELKVAAGRPDVTEADIIAPGGVG